MILKDSSLIYILLEICNLAKNLQQYCKLSLFKHRMIMHIMYHKHMLMWRFTVFKLEFLPQNGKLS